MAALFFAARPAPCMPEDAHTQHTASIEGVQGVALEDSCMHCLVLVLSGVQGMPLEGICWPSKSVGLVIVLFLRWLLLAYQLDMYIHTLASCWWGLELATRTIVSILPVITMVHSIFSMCCCMVGCASGSRGGLEAVCACNV